MTNRERRIQTLRAWTLQMHKTIHEKEKNRTGDFTLRKKKGVM